MIEIIFENESLLAVNKPPGLPVHESPGPGSSVLRELSRQLGRADLMPVHRLDKDASGVLLFAKTKQAARSIQKEWAAVEKTYAALCEGTPPQKSGVIDAPILEHQTGKPERFQNALNYFKKTNPDVQIPPLPAPKTSAVHPAGRPAQTAYQVLNVYSTPHGTWTSFHIEPRQGRMHQIRVHLAHIGCPLVLDSLYGKNSVKDFLPLARMPLHATALQIQWPAESAKTLRIDAPLPADMTRAFALLEPYAENRDQP